MKVSTVLPVKRSRLASVKNYFALREWLTMLVAMLMIGALLGWQNGLGRIDQTVYDGMVSASGRAARDDIIIIAIDDYSLAALGRWPWPRDLHAALINRLTLAKPRVIGLDVILSEPESAPRSGDTAMQKALTASGRVVLPMVMANRGEGLAVSQPIPELASRMRLFEGKETRDSSGSFRLTKLLFAVSNAIPSVSSVPIFSNTLRWSAPIARTVPNKATTCASLGSSINKVAGIWIVVPMRMAVSLPIPLSLPIASQFAGAAVKRVAIDVRVSPARV